MTEGDPVAAARFYAAEIDASEDKAIDPRLYLNAGLAHLEAGSLGKAEKNLEQALDASMDFPDLQSKAECLGKRFLPEANRPLGPKGRWPSSQGMGEGTGTLPKCFLTRWEQKSGRQPVLPSKTVGGKDQFDDLPNDRQLLAGLERRRKSSRQRTQLERFRILGQERRRRTQQFKRAHCENQ